MRGRQTPNALLSLVYGPINLEHVMLADETFTTSVYNVKHQSVHVGDLVDLAVYCYILQTEEAIMNEFEVSIIFNIMHCLIALFK